MNIKTLLELPFKLPIKNNTKIISSYLELAVFVVEFVHNEVTYTIKGADEEYKQITTSAEVIYSPNNDLGDKNDINQILHFMIAIFYLNHFIDSLRFTSDLYNIKNFTIIDLPPIINIEIDNVTYAYNTSPLRILDEDNIASESIIRDSISLMSKWNRSPQLEVVDKFFNKAMHHLYHEEFIFSIFELQTSFEVFIRNSHRLILIYNNEQDDVIDKSKKINFRNVIEDHLAKYLDTDLSFQKNDKIKKWKEKLYNIRNDIVHSGRMYVPGNIAYEAYDAYIDARNYISDLLVLKGYLSPEGMIDLKKFNKNTSTEINHEDVMKKLIDKGLITSDLKLIPK